MIIGVPKEIKTNENRIALVPAGAEALVGAGHTVYVEAGAGLGSGFPDEAYTAVGAKTLPTADEVWAKADMIMKVKEPQESEFALLRPGLIVFTYLHLAAAEQVTRNLVGRTVAEVERDLILETLKHCLGNRTHAANILGISIRTLRNKLNVYADDGVPIPPPNGGEMKGAA